MEGLPARFRKPVGRGSAPEANTAAAVAEAVAKYAPNTLYCPIVTAILPSNPSPHRVSGDPHAFTASATAARRADHRTKALARDFDEAEDVAAAQENATPASIAEYPIPRSTLPNQAATGSVDDTAETADEKRSAKMGTKNQGGRRKSEPPSAISEIGSDRNPYRRNDREAKIVAEQNRRKNVFGSAQGLAIPGKKTKGKEKTAATAAAFSKVSN